MCLDLNRDQEYRGNPNPDPYPSSGLGLNQNISMSLGLVLNPGFGQNLSLGHVVDLGLNLYQYRNQSLDIKLVQGPGLKNRMMYKITR